mmetsp:Transcript_88677/g.197125  ORF Transcript_88677/g.197125 Transcript_88677/m.197125 type:complete len:318 (-) Transcript_88677:278-1231(-)
MKPSDVVLSEALPVDDSGAGLVVLSLRDPHLLEGAERREDRAADPHRVLPLGGRHNLDLHGGGSEGCELLGHALANPAKHRGATRQDHVRIQVLADVDIALHDGLEGGVVDAAGLLADEARLEQHFRAAEALAAHGDDVAVGELVGLLLVRALSGRLHLGVKIQSDVAQLLFDIAHNLALGGGGEGIAALRKDLHQVLSEVPACQVQAKNGVRQGIALIDRHRVRDTIAGVHHDPRSAAGGVQREHSLDRDVHGGHVERLEHDLRHPLAVGLRVQRRLGQQDGVLLGCDTQLVVEGVVPDLLHIIPVCHDAVFNRVL